MRSIDNIPRPFFEIWFFLFSLLLIIIFSFPLALNLSGYFFGFPGDSLGGIYDIWWQGYSHANNIPYQTHNFTSYPFGIDNSAQPFPYISYLSKSLLIPFTDEIVVFNILKLISFPLLSLTSFLLFHYLTKDRTISAVLGIIYAFSPFHTIHNMAHFAALYWLPLALLFFIKALEEGRYINAVLFGLFWGLCFVDNAYYGYFMMLLIPFIIAVYSASTIKRGRIFRLSFLIEIAVSCAVFILVIMPMFYPFLKGIFLAHKSYSTQISSVTRDLSDLFIFSAKPLDYFFPSRHNPFLGSIIPDLGMGPLKGHKYTEHTLYLGYSLLLLAGYSLYSSINKKGRPEADDAARHMNYLFALIALGAVILSAPPFIPLGEYHVNYQTREVIAGHKIILPQYMLHKIFPMFRVYARMGAVVLLAVCVLAAFGLRELSARVRTGKGKVILLLLFSLIIFIEFAELPHFRLTKVREPEVYRWLASRPGLFPVVEYPIGDGADHYTTYEYKDYQRIHEKLLVNGATKGTPADEFRQGIIDISEKGSIDKLKSIGVKYIIFHKYKYIRGNEYAAIDWLTAPPRDKIFPVEYNDGQVPDLGMVRDRIRLVMDSGDSAVYEIN